jgi:hypothetical protein
MPTHSDHPRPPRKTTKTTKTIKTSKTKKPTSARQTAANRANGLQSNGPKTQAGKDRSRFNGLKHGLTAIEVCIPGESEREYTRRLEAYVEIYQPANLVEMDIVEDLVACIWRKRRAARHEALLVLTETVSREEEFSERFSELSPDAEAALAFKSLCDRSNSFRTLERYETTMSNQSHRQRKYLDQRTPNPPPIASLASPAELATPPDQPLRNEPIPINAHHPAEPAKPAANVQLAVEHTSLDPHANLQDLDTSDNTHSLPPPTPLGCNTYN